ncbi:16S rRNA (uracil(1498)-N(3))-methyltransferase [Deinococcus aquatilis]|uniref:16S rRNA (uracil(1498)-N(3))-methyltransferase n=1 Tax=Deinococcus aquatilis TaxID=519440 RepID=UPI0012FBAF7D|nr:16S rRNA (uracil(1498)-N(3))-methyltransferase [Deinococcus aquatilis]
MGAGHGPRPRCRMSVRIKVDALTPTIELGLREARHLQVLRLGPGAVLRVFDGQGQEAEATLTELSELGAVLALGAGVQATAETPQPVTLAIALLKGDKLSDVTRAATELGVARIQLLLTRHADVREIGTQKLLRLRRVAEEASKQSRRAVTPELLEPISIADLSWSGTLFLAHPGSRALITDHLNWNAPITVLTGPEGGFSDAEVAQLQERGAVAVTLGPRILRAETAPIALLGAIVATGV